MRPMCVYTGDHSWNGTGQCQSCGERLRCGCCGCYVREDKINAHFNRCPVIARIVDEERRDIEATFA